jgi:hypothetical protein
MGQIAELGQTAETGQLKCTLVVVPIKERFRATGKCGHFPVGARIFTQRPIGLTIGQIWTNLHESSRSLH